MDQEKQAVSSQLSSMEMETHVRHKGRVSIDTSFPLNPVAGLVLILALKRDEADIYDNTRTELYDKEHNDAINDIGNKSLSLDTSIITSFHARS